MPLTEHESIDVVEAIPEPHFTRPPDLPVPSNHGAVHPSVWLRPGQSARSFRYYYTVQVDTAVLPAEIILREYRGAAHWSMFNEGPGSSIHIPMRSSAYSRENILGSIEEATGYRTLLVEVISLAPAALPPSSPRRSVCLVLGIDVPSTLFVSLRDDLGRVTSLSVGPLDSAGDLAMALARSSSFKRAVAHFRAANPNSPLFALREYATGSSDRTSRMRSPEGHLLSDPPYALLPPDLTPPSEGAALREYWTRGQAELHLSAHEMWYSSAMAAWGKYITNQVFLHGPPDRLPLVDLSDGRLLFPFKFLRPIEALNCSRARLTEEDTSTAAFTWQPVLLHNSRLTWVAIFSARVREEMVRTLVAPSNLVQEALGHRIIQMLLDPSSTGSFSLPGRRVIGLAAAIPPRRSGPDIAYAGWRLATGAPLEVSASGSIALSAALGAAAREHVTQVCAVSQRGVIMAQCSVGAGRPLNGVVGFLYEDMVPAVSCGCGFPFRSVRSSTEIPVRCSGLWDEASCSGGHLSIMVNCRDKSEYLAEPRCRGTLRFRVIPPPVDGSCAWPGEPFWHPLVCLARWRYQRPLLNSLPASEFLLGTNAVGEPLSPSDATYLWLPCYQYFLDTWDLIHDEGREVPMDLHCKFAWRRYLGSLARAWRGLQLNTLQGKLRTLEAVLPSARDCAREIVLQSVPYAPRAYSSVDVVSPYSHSVSPLLPGDSFSGLFTLASDI